MLGSVSEAEDIVQEALLRVHSALDAENRAAGAPALEISGGQITQVISVANPDKLAHLGIVANLGELFGGGAQSERAP
jgi:hypothetical protein